ncbi:hypothetical protein [Peribacillus faecalis]|nr:hypothetical protein [Peribacillus faecalis]
MAFCSIIAGTAGRTNYLKTGELIPRMVELAVEAGELFVKVDEYM